MTNHYTDFKNAKVFLVFSNPAENHPSSMQWINEARANGAKLIVVEPRKTRLAGMADHFVRIRPGTDNAIVNGLVKRVIDMIEAGTLSKSYLTATTSRSFWAYSATYGGYTKVSIADWPKHTDAVFKLNSTRTDYAREDLGPFTVTIGTTVYTDFYVNGVPVRTTISDPDSVFQYLKSRVAAYDPETVADICGCSVLDFERLADMYINNSWAKTQASYGDSKYKVGTILYAMGTTQHSCGSQNIRNCAILQLLLGNMGKYGGGVNALRGWNNVQGICDICVLTNLLPGYIGAPTTGTGYGAFLNKLFGNPVNADGSLPPGSSYGLQQLGYINMLNYWFADGRYDPVVDVATLESLHDNYMCSSKGYTLLDMLKKAKEGHVKALIVLAQNPAVQVANTNLARDGLKELDTLVVMDMFFTETADCERKTGGVTYLLPCASFAEKCGSVTNSGHWITWRYQAIPPKGKCRTDFQIILDIAKKLDDEGAFNAVPLLTGYENRYDMLFTSQYGYDGNPDNWSNNDYKKTLKDDGESGYCERVYKQMCKPLSYHETAVGANYGGGTVWIYSRAGGKQPPGTGIGTTLGGWEPGARDTVSPDLTDFDEATGRYENRSQARDTTTDPIGTALYPGFAHSWLLNRRIFYNNNAAPGDVGDVFVAPDVVARIFVHHTSDTPPTPVDYSYVYRAYTKLAEPDGRTPKHWEPWESPRLDLRAQYPPVGVDPEYPADWADTPVEVAEFPLVLITFRQTEHWHSGQISRNLPWLSELVPKPVVQINSADAADYGIVSGDNVGIISMRTAVKTSLKAPAVAGTNVLTVASTAGFVAGDEILITHAVASNQKIEIIQEEKIISSVDETTLTLTTDLDFDHGVNGSVLDLDRGLVGPFVAEVGTGLQSNQRVGKGTVAVPIHWAERGANSSTAVANMLTINALDANAKMPETKVCLCRIKKL
ncbi:MAG: molybdopterin oxidoreductase family protein [Actinomycetota bacterium]|nr:molybdopterin oxidoreductase family protein [Actinomycetota bacterium]